MYLKNKAIFKCTCFLLTCQNTDETKGSWRPRGGKGDASLLYTMAATGSFA